MSYAFTGQRAHPPRFSLKGLRGLRSLGDCSAPLPGSPTLCRNNATGSVVLCSSCGTAAAPASTSVIDPALQKILQMDGIPISQQGSMATTQQPIAVAAPAGPSPAPAPVFQNIPIPGFTGDFSVPTLDSALEQSLQAKESTFIANAIARGSDSVAAEAADFQDQAQEHCSLYPSSDGCSNMAALVAQYVAAYTNWGKGQSAQVYQGGDTGSLAAPIIPQTPAAITQALAPVITSMQNPPAAPPPAGNTYTPPLQSTQPANPSVPLAPSVTLTNLTNPGSATFNIGDQWAITVTGPANTPVSVSASQNSIPLGTTPMGTTDATGRLALSAVIGAAQVGAWSETWIIGNQALSPITFNVSSASDLSAATNDPALDSLEAAAADLLPSNTTTTATVDATTAWLTSNSLLSVFPNWLTVGGVGLIAYFAFFKDKGKQSK